MRDWKARVWGRNNLFGEMGGGGPGDHQRPLRSRMYLVRSAETPSSSSGKINEPLDRRLGSAAAHAGRNIPTAAPEDTVDSVLERMRGVRFDSAAVVAVCSGLQLAGLVTIERLLAAPGQATVATVMDAQPPVVAPGVDQEHAVWLAAQRAESGLAVVDEQGWFQGVIPPQRLAAILLEEHDEDLVRLGGFLKSSESARSASEESVGRRLWHRLPWLTVGLIGAMVSAVMLASIEDQMSANLAVAYFIPGIVYLADAVGTQTETLPFGASRSGWGSVKWRAGRPQRAFSLACCSRLPCCR